MLYEVEGRDDEIEDGAMTHNPPPEKPQSTSDWGEDCAIGRNYALETIRFLRSTGNVPAFNLIVSELMRSDEIGIAVGFNSQVAGMLIG